LIVRSKVVEVPMGSLLSVMAVTVTANAPAGLDGAVVSVSVEVPAMRGSLARTTP